MTLDRTTLRNGGKKARDATLRAWLQEVHLDSRDVDFAAGYLAKKSARLLALSQVAGTAFAVAGAIVVLGVERNQLGVYVVGAGGGIIFAIAAVVAYVSADMADELIDRIRDVAITKEQAGTPPDQAPRTVARLGRWSLQITD